MGREIVHVSVGQCGNQTGVRFWETIAKEHGLSADGLYVGDDPRQEERMNVYFREARSAHYMARSLLVDMDKSVLNHIPGTTYGKLFNPDNYLAHHCGSENNFMKGLYSEESEELTLDLLDRLRLEMETCESLQALTISHSVAGGTGSGLTCKLFHDFEDILKYSGIWFFSVFPSPSISDTTTENYNALMSLYQLDEAKNVVVLDNEKLFEICLGKLKLGAPSYQSINQLIANVMSSTTAGSRFPGMRNFDLNKLEYSLAVTPFMHYYIPTYAPLYTQAELATDDLSIDKLVHQMCDEDLMMCNCTPDAEDVNDRWLTKYNMSFAALFRGDISTWEIDEAMAYCQAQSGVDNYLRKKSGYQIRSNPHMIELKGFRPYYYWSVRQTFTGVTEVPPLSSDLGVLQLQSNSAIKFKFLKIVRKAVKMFSGSAYAHHFNYKVAGYAEEDMISLEHAIEYMSKDWITYFGHEDNTEFPAPIDHKQLFEPKKKQVGLTLNEKFHAQLDKLWYMLDVDRIGLISREHLMPYCGNDIKMAEFTMDLYDDDGDGNLNRNEFRDMFLSLSNEYQTARVIQMQETVKMWSRFKK